MYKLAAYIILESIKDYLCLPFFIILVLSLYGNYLLYNNLKIGKT